MRILQLRFKNLNSLLGEWQIDLSDPAFGNDGIFAITGPTGAGKSTILDAICLALYGRTPRLNKITKSSNEIMSRHSGECFAEITFETPAGQFRCHWSQHRARKKADGDLQAPKHEIADALSGQIIEAKIRNVAQRIEMITGMDFERFTLSMLLAQGGFAAFLQAAPDQRAPILEQITGSAIYSQISTRVHELRAIESTKLNTLQAELAGMALLSTEDESQLKTQLQQTKEKELTLNGQREQYRQAIEWLEAIDKLQQELLVLDQQKQQLHTRQIAFKPRHEKLEQANRALQLAADYASLCSLRQTQSTDQATQQQCRDELPNKTQALSAAKENAQESQQLLLDTRAEQSAALPKIRQAQGLDLKQREKQAPIDHAEKTLGELKQGFSDLQDQQQQDGEALAQSQTDCTALVEKISESQADETLVEQFSGLQSRFTTLRELNTQQGDKTRMLGEANKQCQQAENTWQQRTATLAAQHKARQDIHNNLVQAQSERTSTLASQTLNHWQISLASCTEKKTRLETLRLQLQRLNELTRTREALTRQQASLSTKVSDTSAQISAQTEKQATLEREAGLLETNVSLLQTIQSFEQARTQLKDGEDCPLCGAKEHPFAAGNIPSPEASSIALDKVKKDLKQVSHQLTAYKVSEAGYSTELEQVAERLRETTQQISQSQTLLEQTQAKLSGSDFMPGSNDRLAELLPQLERDNQHAIDNTSLLLTAVDQQDKALLTLRAALETATVTATDAEKNSQAAYHHKDIAEQTRLRLSGETAALTIEIQQARKAALNEVAAYGLTSLPDDDFSQCETALNSRRDQWLARQQEKVSLDQNITRLSQQTQQQKQLLGERNETLEKQRKLHASLLDEQKTLKCERHTLFADKDPGLEESRLAGAVTTAEQQRDIMGQHYNVASEVVAKLNSRIKVITDNILSRCKPLNIADEKYQQGLEQWGFADEAQHRSAHISDEERNTLASEAEQLMTEHNGLAARDKDRREHLSKEGEKKMTGRAIDPLQQDLDTCLRELETTQQTIGAVQQKLDDNQQLRASQQERACAIDGQKVECERWDNLHLLIGSADGKKYRNFAQGLTFELLVGHANRQLQKMSDRYLLIRDKVEPLELNVIDNYQAGEIRSTKNLSGGESFIVSLALALGLSQMASKNVRVDSLFLDEGFGTLDEDALDTALEALSSLQQSGKLIGVISHVSSLKERIATQIQVSPQTGGRSIITGPGCQRLN